MVKQRRLRGKRSDREQDVIEMLESALHLLKMLPAHAWLLYALGTLPFVSLFLVYWTEMSSSALAYRYLSPGALALAVAYIWMKYWQARWAIVMRNVLVMQSYRPSRSTRFRILLRQAIFQPWGLIIVPLCGVLVIPFPWALAFFQNLTVCESFDEEGKHTTDKALKYASVGKLQLGLFSLLWIQILTGFIFLSWLTILGYLPYLVYMLTGIETVFVRSPHAILNNSSFYVAGATFTYLTLDPVVKAYFFLRCYYADTRETGLDILVTLRRLGGPMARMLIFAAGLALLSGSCLLANEPVDPIPSEQLEQTIDDVGSQRKYIWDQPPEQLDNRGEAPAWVNSFNQFKQDIKEFWHTSWREFSDWFESLFEKEEKKEKEDKEDRKKVSHSGNGIADVANVIAIGLIIILAAIICVMIFRGIRQRPLLASTAPMGAADSPDLTQEEVSADSLSIDRWLEYARELAARQEYRLAMRAVFLAQLAYLAEQRLIVLAKFKSNLEYAHELTRRAHSCPHAIEAFSSSTHLFESIWYGDYPAEPSKLDQMEDLFRTLATDS
ncbi:DUF4129 domain-containing protein [Ruficoccus sp. ZRK36]|uniref:DUF4129 domain-containing protein n=1 Tax=Ruficoccus sp. ZRK36 TaxID=2866311 RepID=UPI001C72A623|nr:DUF4129 domain-containing protein [Ruficoccus sp. ZRK36]QYY35098.1 DUF4129 domain-containing protein [Ruficoccus sp. ZRK36]